MPLLGNHPNLTVHKYDWLHATHLPCLHTERALATTQDRLADVARADVGVGAWQCAQKRSRHIWPEIYSCQPVAVKRQHNAEQG